MDATIFSRVWAPPPPLIRFSWPVDLVGAVEGQVEMPDLVRRQDAEAQLRRQLPRSLRGRGAGDVGLALPEGDDRVVNGGARAETDAHAGLHVLGRAPSRELLRPGPGL
jgi:hypothetical protein